MNQQANWYWFNPSIRQPFKKLSHFLHETEITGLER